MGILRYNLAKIILGLVFLSACVFFGQHYLLKHFHKPTVWQWQLDTASLTRVVWQHQHEKWELFRSPLGWSITDGDLTFELPTDSVNLLLSALATWQPRGYSPAEPTEWKQYGLDSTSERLTFFTNGSKTGQTLWLGVASLPDGSKAYYTRPDWQHDVLLGSPQVGWLADPLTLMVGRPVFRTESPRPLAVRIRYSHDSTITFMQMPTDWRTDTPYNVVLPVLFELLDSVSALRFDAIPQKITTSLTSPLYQLEWEGASSVTTLACWPVDSTAYRLRASTYPHLMWSVSKSRADQLFKSWHQARRLPPNTYSGIQLSK